MRTRIEVEQKYRLGHSYTTIWVQEAGMFCPNCGAKGVWVENGEGDYYVGPPFVCVSCNHAWTMQGPAPFNTDPDKGETVYKQVVDEIRRAADREGT